MHCDAERLLIERSGWGVWPSNDPIRLLVDELLHERARYREALEVIADPSTTDMTWYGTALTLRGHAAAALREEAQP